MVVSFKAFSISVAVCLIGITSTIYWDITAGTTTYTQQPTTQHPEPNPDSTNATTTHTDRLDQIPQFTYLEITNSCTIAITDSCQYAHSAPYSTSPKRQALRNGMVLLVDETMTNEIGEQWHRIAFNEPLRYPERLQPPWYVKAEAGFTFANVGIQEVSDSTPSTTKYILIERNTQMLYAYDGDELFMATSTATGLVATPTPRGHFTVFKMTPTRYMQGPIPGITSQYYDLPGVPWNLYFTKQGAIVHGVYWHDTFGTPYSNGCVNLPTDLARKLYDWAELGMTLIVRD